MYSLKETKKRFGKIVEKVYGSKKEETLIRINEMINEFFNLYGEGEFSVFSVPGRSEICGNHTDHNCGKVACGSIDLDIIAIVRKTKGNIIKLKSKGYDEDVVDITKLNPSEKYFGQSSAIITGVCARMKEKGYKIGGFCAYTESKILKGSGLSSSAAFEDMVVTIEDYLYNKGNMDVIELAKISQYAENVYFGKPCGLMDQIGCAAGGFVFIDFKDKENPKMKRVKFSPQDYGYSLYIVDTGGSHVNLTPDYAAVPQEMKSVASLFGKQTLREVSEKTLISNAIKIRKECGDRALLRSLHYVNENVRVSKLEKALKNKEIKEFFNIVNESGLSSNTLLQNLYSIQSPNEQGISVGCAIAKNILNGDGACRVHGGGFAGTMQAFVPQDKEEEFIKTMKKVFGEKSITKLNIRLYGRIKLG